MREIIAPSRACPTDVLRGLRGLAILDNDGRARQDFSDTGLRIRYWRRYEIANYFLTQDILLAFVERENKALDLFAMPDDTAKEVMGELILERVFGGDRNDYAVWKNSAADAGRLIWEAKTQNLKLSSFAEDFFRRLRDRSGLEILPTKGEFHRLVEFVDPRGGSTEVHEKLDLIADIFDHTAALPVD